MDLSRRYEVDSEVTFQKLEEATVLVHLGTGRIHHTNATGSRIWELLESGKSAGEILTTLENEFDIAPNQLQDDVEAFVDKLSAENMIRPLREGT